MEKKSIGAFIAVLRKSGGMTQKDLADKLAVSDKTVSHWERDESAPDLTLIPVIAEIFGVTCDELLRGEKIKDASEEKPSGKTEKQLRYLLGKSRERFMTRSMVSLGLSIAGLLAAFICNFGFNRAYLGFLIGCIFWAAAVICESVFVSYAFSATGGDEFEGAELNDYKIYTVRLAGKIISAAAVMFSACLPLIIVANDSFQGVTAGTLGWGVILLLAAVAAVVCLFAVYFVNNALLKKGVYKLDKSADIKRREIDRLRVRCAAVIAAILIAISLGQAVFNSAAGTEVFAAGTAFDNFQDFKAYMETEKEGEYFGGAAPMQVAGGQEYSDQYIGDEGAEYFDEYGNPITKEQALTEYIYDDAGNAVYEYVHLNQEVAYIRYSGAGADMFSVTAYTYDQQRAGEAAKSFVNSLFSVLYFIVTGVGFLIYFRKRAKLKKSL